MGGPDRLWFILLVTAVLLSPLFIAIKGIQARQRELALLRKRAQGVAARAASRLKMRMAEPTEELSDGGWTLSGVEHGHAVRLTVRERSATLEVSTERGHPTPWDLVRKRDLGRGGLVNDPEDPYVPLDDSIAGPDVFVRGPDASEMAAELPPRVRERIRSDSSVGVTGGWLATGWSAAEALRGDAALGDALAAWAKERIAEFEAAVSEAPGGLGGDPSGEPSDEDPA